MKKSIEIPEHLKSAWDRYRVLKSRSDHFGNKAFLINSGPNTSREDKEQMWEYVRKRTEFYLQSCLTLPKEFLNARWLDDGSCLLTNGIKLEY